MTRRSGQARQPRAARSRSTAPRRTCLCVPARPASWQSSPREAAGQGGSSRPRGGGGIRVALAPAPEMANVLTKIKQLRPREHCVRTDPPPDDVGVSGPSLGSVLVGCPAVGGECQLEHSGSTRDSLDTQSRAEGTR